MGELQHQQSEVDTDTIYEKSKFRSIRIGAL